MSYMDFTVYKNKKQEENPNIEKIKKLDRKITQVYMKKYGFRILG